MASLSLVSEIDSAGNAISRKGMGQKKIILLGHIDTVPGEIPIKIEDGRLYGRGSVDAKGPLAAFVDAAARVTVKPDWQLIVIGAVEEEGDSKGALFVSEQPAPDFLIIGEPSHWDRITLGYKGSAWAEITWRGKMGHTAGGQNSICEIAYNGWQKIITYCKNRNSESPLTFDQLTPTLRSMQSGEDGFEEWASLRIGVRLPPDYSPEDWYDQLTLLLPNSHIRRLGFPVPAYRGDRNNSLVRAFLKGIRSSGGEPGFVLKTGTSDMNITAPRWSCPAVAYGPGNSALDHTPDEHIEIQEYKRAVDVLVVALERLMEDTLTLPSPVGRG